MLQATYDDVLERLKGQSTALLQALGNGGGMAGAADETALAQVCGNILLQTQCCATVCLLLPPLVAALPASSSLARA